MPQLAHALSSEERELLLPWFERRVSLLGKAYPFDGAIVAKSWLTNAVKLAPGSVKINAEVNSANSPRPGICSLHFSATFVMGECNCRRDDTGAANCVHLMTLAESLLKQKVKPLSPAVESLQKKLGVPLDPVSLYFILGVEKMLAIRQGSFSLRQLLHPNAGIVAPLWGQEKAWPADNPPQNLLEAVVLVIKAVPDSIPKQLRELVTPRLREEVLQHRERPKEVQRWRRLLSEMPALPDEGEAHAPASRVQPPMPELRLRITCTQSATSGRIVFSSGESAELSRLSRYTQALRENRDKFDPVSRVLAQYIVEQGSGMGPSSATGSALNSLIHGLLRADAALQYLPRTILTAAGSPFIWHQDPLEWHVEMAKPPDEQSDYAGDLLLRLCIADGTAVPPCFCVAEAPPGQPGSHFYFADGNVWPLQHYPFEENLSWPQKVPMEVAASPLGEKLLRKLGKQPIKELAASYMVVSYRPVVSLSQQLDPYSHLNLLKMELTSECEEGLGPKRTYLGKGWKEEKFTPSAELRSKVVHTDLSGEDFALEWLTLFGWKWITNEWRHGIALEECVDEFVEWLEERPSVITVRLGPGLEWLGKPAMSPKLRLAANPDANQMDWFDIDLALDVEDISLTNAEIALLLRVPGRWVNLPGKGFRKIEEGLPEDTDESLAKLGLPPLEQALKKPQRMHMLQLAPAADAEFLEEKFAEALQKRVKKGVDLDKPDVPQTVTAQLRPYQVEGFHFLSYLSKNRFGGVLADDMGLGKTLQTLTWIAWLKKENPQLEPVLVICPKSVVDNWISEVKRFIPSLRVATSTAARFISPDELDSLDLLVINHAQARIRESDFGVRTWGAIIVDEAQALKNPQSQTSMAICGYRSSHRLALTGTPIENRLLDLWSIMRFAMPGLLGGRTEFTKSYESRGDQLSRVRLSNRMRPFLLRRNKKEVARDLPDRVEEDLLVEMDGLQRQLYDAELKRTQMILLKMKTPGELDKARFSILASLMKLRQICCDPRLLGVSSSDEPETAAKGKKPAKAKKVDKLTEVDEQAIADSAKLTALLELLEPVIERGEKILIFSQFVSMLNLVEKACAAAGHTTFMLTGATENRGELVETFQKYEGGAAFLISLKAGGSGLNLTSASYVVIYDPWWNPAVENQAIDRTHRIGQKQTVFAYRLVAKNTIEEKIRELQAAKANLANDVLGEEGFAKALSKEDFQYLFST